MSDFDREAFAADLIAWAEVRQREAVDDKSAGHPWPAEKIGRTNMLLNAATIIGSPAPTLEQVARTVSELHGSRWPDEVWPIVYASAPEVFNGPARRVLALFGMSVAK